MKRGGVKVVDGRVYARIRYGKNERFDERLPWAVADDDAARERSALISELCSKLFEAGRKDLLRATAKEAAQESSPVRLAKIVASVDAFVKRPLSTSSITHLPTVFDVGEMWTSGELRKKYPDHVRKKVSFKLEVGRLNRYIYPLLRDVPMAAFTLEHAELVMAKLPARRIKTSAARRQVATIITRLVNLSVFPLKLLKASPIPKGWLPRADQNRHYTCLFPKEESLFLLCTEIDEAFRLFIGILDREGMRVSELADSEWWQWNLDVGTFTATRTKTGDPRMWALRQDTKLAMQVWSERHGRTKARPFIDVVPDSSAKLYLAERLRESLALAGVGRKELFENTEFTGKLRAHDMRATFVTVSLAEGKTDAWIRDRTAHRTTGMIERYKRTARQFAELQLGSLVHLADALGWVTSRVTPAVDASAESELTAENHNQFRRIDSNYRKRNQNPLSCH